MGVRIEISKETAWEEAASGADVEVTRGVDGRDAYLLKKFDGFVLHEGEINGRDDSDFYAVVWNPFAGDTFRYTFATTRGWTYNNGCAIDATPEVRAAFTALRERREAERREAMRAAEAARVDVIGRRVKVVKGRKVAIGTTGTVFWVGRGYRNAVRVGVKDATGTAHWLAAANLAVA